MLVVTGFFDNEKFIPDNPVVIPQKKKVVITIEEEKDFVGFNTEREERLAALNRITGVISGNSMTLEDARMERLSRQ
jgi:hypothetical protein